MSGPDLYRQDHEKNTLFKIVVSNIATKIEFIFVPSLKVRFAVAVI
jgi:hypothetical protein